MLTSTLLRPHGVIAVCTCAVLLHPKTSQEMARTILNSLFWVRFIDIYLISAHKPIPWVVIFCYLCVSFFCPLMCWGVLEHFIEEVKSLSYFCRAVHTSWHWAVAWLSCRVEHFKRRELFCLDSGSKTFFNHGFVLLLSQRESQILQTCCLALTYWSWKVH